MGMGKLNVSTDFCRELKCFNDLGRDFSSNILNVFFCGGWLVGFNIKGAIICNYILEI